MNTILVRTLSVLALLIPSQLKAANHAPFVEKFEAVEKRSTSILMIWKEKPGEIYLVKATYSNLPIDSCEGGTEVAEPFYRFESITHNNESFKPRTLYNLAACPASPNFAGLKNSLDQQVIATGPEAPNQLKLSNIQIDRMTLTWSDPDRQTQLMVTKYVITCKRTSDGEILAPKKEVAADETKEIVIKGLAANTNYTVVVVSYTNDLRVFSDESVPALGPTVPGNVTDVELMLDAQLQQLVATWVKPEGGEAIQGYLVEWKIYGDSEKVESSELILHDPHQKSYCFVTSSVKDALEYEVTITALNEVGKSETTKKAQAYVFWQFFDEIIGPSCIIHSVSTTMVTITMDTSTPAERVTSEALPTSYPPTETTADLDSTTKLPGSSFKNWTSEAATTQYSHPMVETSEADSITEALSQKTDYIKDDDTSAVFTTAISSLWTSVNHIETPQPFFNITTTLTSIKIEWLKVEDQVEYLVIQSDPENEFATARVSSNQTSHTIRDVSPYAEYTVVMYSVIIYDGTEFRSNSTTQTVSTFAEVHCPKSSIAHEIDTEVLVTFPSTQAGYTNISIEACSSETANEGTPLGSRTCSLDGVWLDPIWISSCNTSLHLLAATNISTEEQRYKAASDLVIHLTNSSVLSQEDVENSIFLISSILDVDELQQNISSLVLQSIGSLLALPSTMLHANGVAKSLRFSLDEIASKVILKHGEQYESVVSEIALAVQSTTTSKSFGYVQRYNPNTEKFGFSSGQFEVTENFSFVENTSFILLPLEAINEAQGGRVSFFAFLDEKIFQISDGSGLDMSQSINAAAPHASVQSNVVLSASIVGEKVNNLKDSVSMIFQLPKDTYTHSCSPNDCGRYFCGFWDEGFSFWSDEGCAMTLMTGELIECQCNHLTNFAALFAQGNSSKLRNSSELDIITLVGCSISLVATLLTIGALIVAWHSSKLTIQKRTLFLMLNLSVALSLLYGFVLLSFLDDVSKNDDFCTAVAVILHFALFSSFSWMMAEAIYVYLGTVKPLYFRSELTDFKVWLVSAVWGWGFPIFFVTFSAGLSISSYQKSPDDASNICWISPEMMPYLVIIPAAIILSVNVIIYIIVVKTFASRRFGKKSTGIISGKNFAFSLTLFLVFGISWIFGFLLFDSNTANLEFAYIFTITTSLQGFFLFLLFVVRNKEIRMSVAHEMQSFHSKVFSSDRITSETSTNDSSSYFSNKSQSEKWCSSRRLK